jgi:hypothetical protein
VARLPALEYGDRCRHTAPEKDGRSGLLLGWARTTMIIAPDMFAEMEWASKAFFTTTSAHAADGHPDGAPRKGRLKGSIPAGEGRRPHSHRQKFK